MLQRTSPPTVKAGQPFSYEIIVRNGVPETRTWLAINIAAQQVRVEEDLPPGTKFLGAQPPAAVEGDCLMWNFENIAPGTERRRGRVIS